MTRVAFTFDCEGSPLLGLIDDPGSNSRTGILMVVGGGPQYRVGGHRQLSFWAQEIASEGYPVMRFDYRGMGDSGGTFSGFENIQDDLDAAIQEFLNHCPAVTRVVLWGECDASSAIMMFAASDPRIVGISLQNPWVRSVSGAAKTYLKHYYLERLRQRSFWEKIYRRKFNPLTAFKSLTDLVYKSKTVPGKDMEGDSSVAGTASQEGNYILRMKKGLQLFQGPVLLVMSGRDLIAREFDELVGSDREWAKLINNPGVTRVDVLTGDHTFSSDELKKEVLAHGISWLKSL